MKKLKPPSDRRLFHVNTRMREIAVEYYKGGVTNEKTNKILRQRQITMEELRYCLDRNPDINERNLK